MQQSQTNINNPLTCQCGKIYKRQFHFANHTAICKTATQEYQQIIIDSVEEEQLEITTQQLSIIERQEEALLIQDESIISFVSDGNSDDEYFGVTSEQSSACSECNRVMYCPCKIRDIELKFTSDKRNRDIEEYAVDTINCTALFKQPIVDLYLETRYGKSPLLVVVHDTTVERIDMAMVPFLQPREHIAIDTISVPLNDTTQEPMIVQIPVKIVGDDMVWRCSEEMSAPAEQQNYYMQTKGWGRNTLSKLVHDHKIQFKLPESLSYCYYDIETFSSDPDWQGVPVWTHSSCHIAMIQFVMETAQRSTRHVWINGTDYKWSSAAVQDTLIVTFDDEELLCRAFMKMLSENGHTICVAYNGSGSIIPHADENGKYKQIHNSGYDLPWIINRSRQSWTPTYKKWACKYFPIKIVQSTSFDETPLANCIGKIIQLPMVQFVEAMRSVTDAFVQAKCHVASLSLRSVCEHYKVTQSKGECDFVAMFEAFRSQGSDITQYIQYGIQDCVALQDLMSNHILDMKMGACFVESYQIPLNWTIHWTPAQQLEHHLVGQYRNNNYMCCYIPRSCDVHLKGAYTAAQPGFYESVLQLDYASMYPNILVQFFLSIENLREVQSSTTKTILIADETKPVTYHFEKNMGVLATEIAALYQKRVDAKLQMKPHKKGSSEYSRLDRIQYCCKIAINSAFGLCCYSMSLLFCLPVGMSITGMGRSIIVETNNIIQTMLQDKHCIIANDTDACNIILPESIRNASDVVIFAAEVNRQVQLRYTDTTTSGIVVDRMTLSYEEIVERLWVSAKKSYIWHQLSTGTPAAASWVHHTLRDESFQLSTDVKQRGVVYTGVTQQGAVVLKSIVLEFMTSMPEPLQFVTMIYNRIHDAITSAVEQKDMTTLATYADRKKNTRGNNICRVMCDKYPQVQEEGFIECLYMKSSSQAIAQAAIPIQCLKLSQIQSLDIVKITTAFVSRFQKVINASLDQSDKKTITQQLSVFKQMRNDVLHELQEDQIMVRQVKVGHGKSKQSIVSMDIDSLRSAIQAASSTTFHETITQDTIRFTMDLDNLPYEDTIERLLQEAQVILQRYSPVPVIIRSLKNESKGTFHCYTNVSCSLSMARHIAHEIKRTNRLYSGVIDTAIYKMYGQLRLPECCNIKNNIRISGTEYKLPPRADHIDYIMTCTIGCTYINTPLHLLTTLAIDDEYIMKTNAVGSESHVALLRSWLQTKNITIASATISGNIIATMNSGSYTCPIHNRVHQNDNLFAFVTVTGLKLSCHRWTKEDQGTPILIPFQEAVVEPTMLSKLQDALQQPQSRLKGAIIQDQQHVDFQSVVSPTIFVKSGLGSGKTYQMVARRSANIGTMMAVSARITFTQSVVQQYAGAISYQDITGVINFEEARTVIVQIDSLSRVSASCIPDILVLDEIESILSQAMSRNCTRGSTYDTLKALIVNCKELVVLDGFLQQATIDWVLSLRKQSYVIIENVYQSYTKIPCVITMTEQRDSVVNQILQVVMQDHSNQQKTVISCTGIKRSKILNELITKQGLSVLHIHGDQLAIEEDGTTHQDFKKRVVPQLTQYSTDVDVIIYTGTLSAGVDCQIQVGHVIGWLTKRTSDAMQFVQGLYRFRNHSQMKLFIPNTYENHNVTPYTLCPTSYNSIINNQFKEQMMIWLTARQQCIQASALQIVIRQVSRQGHPITWSVINNDKDQIVKDINKKITMDTMPQYDAITVDDLRHNQMYHDGKDIDVTQYTDAIRTISMLRSAHLNDEQILQAHTKYQVIHELMQQGTARESVDKYLRKHGSSVALYRRIQLLGSPENRIKSDVKNRTVLGVVDTTIKLTTIKEEQDLYAIAALLPTLIQETAISDPCFSAAISRATCTRPGSQIVKAYAIKGLLCSMKDRKIKGTRTNASHITTLPMIHF